MMKNAFIVRKTPLILISLITLALLTIPAWYVGVKLLHLSKWFVGIVLALPLLTAAFYFFKNGRAEDKFKSILTGSKYRFFPLFIFYDPEPVKRSRFRPADGWSKVIEEGDLILRRHDNYLDGIVLRQAGYYTHAGIAKKENENVYVYHAVGTGIHKVEINEFAHCDEITVLRITKENIKRYLETGPSNENASNKLLTSEKTQSFLFEITQQELPVIPRISQEKRKTKAKENVLVDEFRDMIKESGEKLELDEELRCHELRVYDLLKEKNPDILTEKWQCVVTDLAKAYYIKNLPYDFAFDFIDPKIMSCVEFAWNCYKSLFPVHQVARKRFKFFNVLPARILAPDLFLAEDKFSCIFKSGEQYDLIKQFIKFCRDSKFQFWLFVLKYVVCQFIILGLFYVVKQLWV